MALAQSVMVLMGPPGGEKTVFRGEHWPFFSWHIIRESVGAHMDAGKGTREGLNAGYLVWWEGVKGGIECRLLDVVGKG